MTSRYNGHSKKMGKFKGPYRGPDKATKEAIKKALFAPRTKQPIFGWRNNNPFN